MNSTNSTFYKNSKFVITYEGRRNLVKQNNGLKYSIVGAVLFSDKNNVIKAYSNNNTLEAISWKFLQEKTQIIFKDVQYDYVNGLYIPDENQYNEAIDNPISYLLPTLISYSKNPYTPDDNANDEEEKYDYGYISYDVMIRANSVSIFNQTNADMAFDGIALLAVPYKIEDIDLMHPLLDNQDLICAVLEYFPDLEDQGEKIWILHDQNKKLVFNSELHLNIGDDIELINNNPYEYGYEGLQEGLHIINNGTSNKTLKNITTYGGTTKLFLR